MLLIPGLLPVFYTYQLYQQIKDMKTWQQVLAQQMKPLISPILMILTPGSPTFLGCFKLPVPLSVGRPQTITGAAVRVQTNLSGRLESHQRGFGIETFLLCPGDLLSKSSKLTFSRKRWWGDSPLLMLEE